MHVPQCYVFCRVLEDVDEDEAVALYFAACSYFDEGDKDHYAANTFRSALTFMLRVGRYALDWHASLACLIDMLDWHA